MGGSSDAFLISCLHTLIDLGESRGGVFQEGGSQLPGCFFIEFFGELVYRYDIGDLFQLLLLRVGHVAIRESSGQIFLSFSLV